MKTIMYLQKNPFYSLPVVAEISHGHFTVTDRSGAQLYDAFGPDATVKFVMGWGLKVTVDAVTFRLYVYNSAFSPSPSQLQLDAVNGDNSGEFSGYDPLGAMSTGQDRIHALRQALQDIHAILN